VAGAPAIRGPAQSERIFAAGENKPMKIASQIPFRPLVTLMLGMVFGTGLAHAAPLPPCAADPNSTVPDDVLVYQELQSDCVITANPGTSFVTTSSTTAVISYVDTPVTQTVDDYSTTVLALLNGGGVFSESFTAPFSDPSVQAAVADADGILSADGASFGGPALISSSSVLLSSTTPAPTTYNCATVGAAPGASVTGSVATETTTFGGPSTTVMIGACQSDEFTILDGQTDISVNVENDYSVPRTIVTTDTYLDSQTYEITGTTGATGTSSVPEPSSAGLVLLGLGALAMSRRTRLGAV
jgi:PEP-CTERM motif-containing protein